MQSNGLKATQIARRLGVNRRRIDKWLRLDTLPERSRQQLRPPTFTGYSIAFCAIIGCTKKIKRASVNLMFIDDFYGQLSIKIN